MLQTTLFSQSPGALQLNHNHNRRIFSWGRGSVGVNSSTSNIWRQSLFVSAKPVLEDGVLSVNGQDVLTEVPENVVVTPLTNSSALWVSLLKLLLHAPRDVRLLSLFKFKLWWLIPRVGNMGSDIPVETQMLLLLAKEGTDFDALKEATPYILFLPVLDGEFRSSLQGNSSNELEFCVESGDPAIVISQSPKAVFVKCGNHPFDLRSRILEKHFGTFSLRESKQIPGMLDWFGWCNWDAFYKGVNPQGIREGTKRINSIQENSKFRRTTSKESQSETPNGLKEFVSEIKGNFGLSSKKNAITRASDDNYPENRTTQTLHVAAVAFNHIFLGEVVVPDWDMFYSNHDADEFHAAARAVGGCGVELHELVEA